MLECVINISEGRQLDLITQIGGALGSDLLDIHSDYFHHRSVFTLVGNIAPKILAEMCINRFDLSKHIGVHPRIGIIDVVPFVPLHQSTLEDAISARNEFAEDMARRFSIPSFVYGPERDLPEIRKLAFTKIMPEFGPNRPHPSVGAICVGARQILVAYNIWLKDSTLDQCRNIAKELRSRQVRTLGLQLGERMQVSMNLIEPLQIGPAQVFDEVAKLGNIEAAELVGLIPQQVLHQIPKNRWPELDLGSDKTIESRLDRRLGIRH